jgi:hypothetical protein
VSPRPVKHRTPNVQRPTSNSGTAGGGARTHTILRSLDFESSASANSATPAIWNSEPTSASPKLNYAAPAAVSQSSIRAIVSREQPLLGCWQGKRIPADKSFARALECMAAPLLKRLDKWCARTESRLELRTERWMAHLFVLISRLGLCEMVAPSQSPGYNGC